MNYMLFSIKGEYIHDFFILQIYKYYILPYLLYIINVCHNTLLEYDVVRHASLSVVMDAGSRIVNFIVNFIRDGTVFA